MNKHETSHSDVATHKEFLKVCYNLATLPCLACAHVIGQTSKIERDNVRGNRLQHERESIEQVQIHFFQWNISSGTFCFAPIAMKINRQ